MREAVAKTLHAIQRKRKAPKGEAEKGKEGFP